MTSKQKIQKIVALIPLRGGSKSIPRKNIKVFAGKPLCYWACKVAVDSEHIDEVWVSTEDSEIKEVVLGFNLGVKVQDRPKELAADDSSTEGVMLHFAKEVPFDILVTLQATSPFTDSKDLDNALKEFDEKSFDSMVSGVLLKRFFWTPDGTPLNYNPLKRPRRQDFSGTVMENGAFYVTKRKILEDTKSRLGGKIGVFQMAEYTATEIDEPEDWARAEGIFKNLNI